MDNDDKVDESFYECGRLRFSFRDIGFGSVYPILQEAGWTFHPQRGMYTDTNNTQQRQWYTAAQLLEQLDATVVNDIYSELEDDDDDDPQKNDSSLRNKVWKLYHQRYLKDQPKEGNDNDSKPKQTLCTRKAKKTKATRKSRRVQSSAAASSSSSSKRSATIMEKGSDLHIRGKAKQKKIEASTELANIERPSLKECQAFVQSNLILKAQNTQEPSNDFEQWRFLLSAHANLLLYGSGSKRQVLNQFLATLQRHVVYTIEGLDCSVSDIVDLLDEHVSNGGEETSSAIPLRQYPNVPVVGRGTPWYQTNPLLEQAISIGRRIAHEGKILCLGIHNLEQAVTSSLDQQALWLLMANSRVANAATALRIVGSVNHVDAPSLIFPKWTHQLVDTGNRPFDVELSTLQSKLVAFSKSSATLKRGSAGKRKPLVDRVGVVLKSLAPRHAEVVKILACLQIEADADWIPYKDWYRACKAKCAVSKDTILRSFLGELQDHEIVEKHEECVRIPYAAAKLQEIGGMKL